MTRYLLHKRHSRISLLFLLLFVAACEQTPPPSQAVTNMPPPAVTVAYPLVQEITDWDEFTGRIQAVESVEVRPRVSGYLESIHFEEGGLVNKGDLLYVIDPRPYQAVLNEARAQVTRAEAALELAEIEVARAERLYKSHAISEQELDSRSNQRREARASLEAAKAAVEAARLNVEFTHITAPISGRISQTRVTKGNLITGGDFDSTLLTTIVSLDPIYVYFTADEQAVLNYIRMDLAGIRQSSRNVANPVLLRLADEQNYVHEGRMDFVDNQIDLATGTMRARAVVNNPDYLLVPGMFADVRLLGKGPYEAILIPDAAIGLDQTIQFVYVVGENNIAERRQIETGDLHNGLRVITSGLDADDRVVINGLLRVRPGQPVTPEAGEIVPTRNQQG